MLVPSCLEARLIEGHIAHTQLAGSEAIRELTERRHRASIDVSLPHLPRLVVRANSRSLAQSQESRVDNRHGDHRNARAAVYVGTGGATRMLPGRVRVAQRR